MLTAQYNRSENENVIENRSCFQNFFLPIFATAYWLISFKSNHARVFFGEPSTSLLPGQQQPYLKARPTSCSFSETFSAPAQSKSCLGEVINIAPILFIFRFADAGSLECILLRNQTISIGPSCAFTNCCMGVCVWLLLVVNSVDCPEGGVSSRSLVRMSSGLPQPTGTQQLMGDSVTQCLADLNATNVMMNCSGSPQHFHPLIITL